MKTVAAEDAACACVLMYTNTRAKVSICLSVYGLGVVSIKPADEIGSTPSGDGLSQDRLSPNEIPVTLVFKQGLQTVSDWLWTNQWFVWTGSKIVNFGLELLEKEKCIYFSEDLAVPLPLHA